MKLKVSEIEGIVRIIKNLRGKTLSGETDHANELVTKLKQKID